jgi:methionine biosynthesis protein MetW
MRGSVKGYYEKYWLTRANEQPIEPNSTLLKLYARNVRASDMCIDIGCGSGFTSGLWLARNTAAYTGVDVSATAVEKAGRLGLAAQLIDDASDLPFEDSSFDLAVCIEVLEHLFQPEQAAHEMRRILRPGGRLIVTVPNVAHWRRRADLVLLGRWHPGGDELSVKEPWRDPHIRFFTVRALERMLCRAGFSDVRVGATSEAFLTDVPGLRRLGRRADAGPIYSRLCSGLPSLFGRRIYAVGFVAGASPQRADG